MNPALARKSGMNRALTLIELLVVITIIAVLAAMLLPVLATAKNHAQMSIDLDNVHQIMMAAHLYANDNNGFLPQPGAYMTYPSWCCGMPFPVPGPGGTRATYDQYYPLQVRSFKSLDATGHPLARSCACQYTPYLQNPKVLTCPADVPNALYYRRQVYHTSYCWNQAVIGDSTTPVTTVDGISINTTLKLSQFKSDDILLWENDELNVLTDVGAWNDTTSCPDVGISARHGKGATVGNADGSAERILLSTYYMMAANQPYKWTGGWWRGSRQGEPLPNRVWCNPLRADGASIWY